MRCCAAPAGAARLTGRPRFVVGRRAGRRRLLPRLPPLPLPPLSIRTRSSHAAIYRLLAATPRRPLRPVAVATPDRQAAASRPSGGGSRGLQPAAPSQPSRLAFLDEDGQLIKPMPADYGFRSGSGRLYQQVGLMFGRRWGVARQCALHGAKLRCCKLGWAGTPLLPLPTTCCWSQTLQHYGTIPKNVLELSVENFRRELRALRRSVRYDELSEVGRLHQPHVV